MGEQGLKPHRPNHIPRRTRTTATVFGLLCLQFALIAGANGLVYLPGKRSETMLSGGPTLLIVVASLCLSVASALFVIDHHDRRPNEATYQRAMRLLGWLAGALYLAAPLMEHLLPSAAQAISWHVDWFDLRPDAIAQLLMHYPPSWRPGLTTVLVASGGLVVVGLLMRLHPPWAKARPLLATMGVCVAVLGASWLLDMLFDVAGGQLASAHGNVAMAWSSAAPSRFQALAGTYLTLSLLCMTMGALLAVCSLLPPLPSGSGNQRKT